MNSSEFCYLSLLFYNNIKFKKETIYSYKNPAHKAKVKFISLVLIDRIYYAINLLNLIQLDIFKVQL